MRVSLKALHDSTGELVDTYGLLPSAGSIAAEEINSFFKPVSVKTALSQGGILLDAAGDHVIAVCRTLEEPVQSIACWTCGRAVIELSALSCWLLDENIDAKTRVTRSISMRYEDIRQRDLYLREVTNNEYSEAINFESLVGLANELGLKQIRNSKDRLVGIGVPFPSTTKIIRSTLDESATYRLFSGASHGKMSILNNLSYAVSEIDVDDPDVTAMELEIHPSLAGYIINRVGYCFLNAVVRRMKLFGHLTPVNFRLLRLSATSINLDADFLDKFDPSA